MCQIIIKYKKMCQINNDKLQNILTSSAATLPSSTFTTTILPLIYLKSFTYILFIFVKMTKNLNYYNTINWY